jgi:hypothetical protein
MQVIMDMEKYWQKQFDQNYARSLDHRSFYFKSIDKKVLGNRHIVAELKDAAEANAARPEAALLVHPAVPACIKLRPDLVLDMPTPCVAFSCPGSQRVPCSSFGPAVCCGTEQNEALLDLPRLALLP